MVNREAKGGSSDKHAILSMNNKMSDSNVKTEKPEEYDLAGTGTLTLVTSAAPRGPTSSHTLPKTAGKAVANPSKCNMTKLKGTDKEIVKESL